ncbi:MAG: hypothetical protein HY658_11555 [Actinobacteria bacterium]|nr:hypothetical protein [Actinomycetota bacterium]
MIEFTAWAEEILTRTHAAARRFNPDAIVRMHRVVGEVRFDLTDRAEEGDELVERDGFLLLVERGLDGVVDVVEPHDRLVLRDHGEPVSERGEPG